MKILIHGLNCAPEKVGIAVYTSEMAEALVARGHEVHVVCGQPYYPAWKIAEGHSAWLYQSETRGGVQITRVPHYIPAQPSGAKRLIHHASFAATSLPPLLAKAVSFRPDVVLAVAPSLVAAPMARLTAALTRSPSWLHIQDLEVEAAFATGLIREGGRLARWARGFERAVTGSFGKISSISPQMCAKITLNCRPSVPVYEFRNWADIDAITPTDVPSPYRAEWNITTPFVALYSGNIANKQGIEIVVEAAQRLRERGDLTFVVCGEGPNRANLERQASGLTNIVFHDLQPKERLGDLLSLATVHLLPQIAGAADLVMPSKLTNMLASGRPIVVTADPQTALGIEVEGCGKVVPPGSGEGLARGLAELLDDAELRHLCGVAARQRAEERWSKTFVLAAFEAELVALVEAAKAPRTTSKAP
ncbi:WcaI family glycosyltransferase [Ancylobacter pratisalsi]|uniref:WcaI family glycosyltransferase n=1 Tax=Ancylobacter pratisalsi TaxID=1745854 RepID=A0A6P1YRA6_9HYPH|nr:WcaI family glycosyltransferase [Ancylobacter pratisalsi]QIB34274.1 WcaI family glycosyltransferase [Ancylobacter pratisalsi]